MSMLTIYTHQKTERLLYTLSIVFDIRGIAWRCVDDMNEFEMATTPKFAYSDLVFKDAPSLSPSSLLFEKEILRHTVLKSVWRGNEVLSINGVSDILSSIFYVISLYDDYLQENRDKHQRNEGKSSMLHQNGWLEKLMVERWATAFISFLEIENKCSLNAVKIPFKVVPTFDVDNAYAYHLKTGWRKILSVGKDIVKRDWFRIKERRNVQIGKQKDPYDTYAQIKEIADKGYDVKVFWLLGAYGSYDKNIAPQNLQHRELIQSVSTYADVGLHPSYGSNQKINQLLKEKEQLEEILGHVVKISRQHFLKIQLPSTFQVLQSVGFTDDYSLAYADSVGFRAGAARPFLWFDLALNKVSKLTLHPISYMDGTLNEYMNLSVEQAIERVKQLKAEVKTYGGTFVPLWHNETINDRGNWEHWNAILLESLK